MNVTTDQAIASLRSTTCPACAGPKESRKSVCGTCFRMLPVSCRNSLYRLVGRGYEQAIGEAMDWLEAQHFMMPPAAQPEPRERPRDNDNLFSGGVD